MKMKFGNLKDLRHSKDLIDAYFISRTADGPDTVSCNRGGSMLVNALHVASFFSRDQTGTLILTEGGM